jgi:hypothetical protein
MATLKPAEPSTDEVKVFYDFLTEHANGQAHAMTARDLAAELMLGKSGDRRLRQLVHAANEAGLLVVADNAGYFIPLFPSEVDEAVGRLRSQAAEMMERARLIESLSMSKFYSTQTSFLA